MSEKSIRKFIFSSVQSNAVSVQIEESLSPQYHAFIWPCGVVLGQYIYWWYLHNKTQLVSLSGEVAIIEIGAGCSLPSLLFARLLQHDESSFSKQFPKFFATDGHQCFDYFSKQLESNCCRNEIPVSAINCYPVTWGRKPTELPQSAVSSKRKILLCADCFYDSKDFDDVVVTISYLLHRGCLENTTEVAFNECWCTVQIRSANHNIGLLLEQWQLTFERIPLETFEANSSSLAGSSLPGRSIVEMFVFRPICKITSN